VFLGDVAKSLVTTVNFFLGGGGGKKKPVPHLQHPRLVETCEMGHKMGMLCREHHDFNFQIFKLL